MHCGEILLVDDDPTSLFITESIIKSTADEVCAHLYQEAEPAIQFLTQSNSKFTVLFLDLNLKDRSGWDFIDELRQHKSNDPELTIPPIVILTSSISEREKLKADQYEEVVGFISKPFMPEHCLEVMDRIGLA